MKKTLLVTILLGASVAAQNAPEIAYEAADILKLPDTIHLGEAAGVATNSKGHIFVYTRTGAAHATVGESRTFYKGGSRLFEFDQTGKYVREIGVGMYGFNFAQQVRIDPQDNIWVVDQGSSNVIKFDSEGHHLLTLSRKPEAISVRPLGAPGGGRGGPEGRGAAPASAPAAATVPAGATAGAPAPAPAAGAAGGGQAAAGGGRLGAAGPPGS